MAERPSLLSELKRRNVLRAGALYIGTIWLLAQAITQLGPVFDMPVWVARWFLAAAAVGFPFWIALAWFYELTPDGLKRESEIAAGESIRQLTGRRFDRAIIAVLALALVLLLTNTLMGRRGGLATERLERSIAVLPLVNASNDPDQRFFSDGLTENLIDSLSGFDGLKVIGRISAFQFRDSRDDSATIGRKLGVAYLLSGSVQRAGQAVRINAALTQAADGSTLWAEHYDRPYTNLFALQDEIALAVAGALRVKLLSPRSTAQLADRPPSANLDAYDTYLRGLAYWHNEAFPQATEYMTRAVRLDPGYAMAWALLSGSRSTAAVFGDVSPEAEREHLREARIAADKALQLAPNLGPAHAARAYLDFYAFDAGGALAECRRAVSLAADDGTVLNGCGYTLTGIGKLGEAIRLRERLLSIEPLYMVNQQQYATLLMATGRLDEAEKYLRTVENLPPMQPDWPSSIRLSRMTLALLHGNAHSAMAIATQAPAGDRTLLIALAAQIGPDSAAADAALASALDDKAAAQSHPYQIAQIYALRGRADHAVAWLQRTPSSYFLFMLADPLMLRLRDDPRFVDFCRQVGLPAPGESEALSIDQVQAMQGNPTPSAMAPQFRPTWDADQRCSKQGSPLLSQFYAADLIRHRRPTGQAARAPALRDRN